jgi:tRNA(fMet)-specific endonuclease VapC
VESKPSARLASPKAGLTQARQSSTANPSKAAKSATFAVTRTSWLAQLGLTPAFADGQIAAVARANQLVLVTANVADFAAFEGLAVEDWRA